MGSPGNLAGIRRSQSEKITAVVAFLNRFSDGCRRWFTVRLVGLGTGEGEEEKGTGGVAGGGRTAENRAGEGGCPVREERESRRRRESGVSRNGNPRNPNLLFIVSFYQFS